MFHAWSDAVTEAGVSRATIGHIKLGVLEEIGRARTGVEM